MSTSPGRGTTNTSRAESSPTSRTQAGRARPEAERGLKTARRLEWIEGGVGTRLDVFELESPSDLRSEDFSFDPPADYAIEVHEAGPRRGTPTPSLTLQLANGDTIALDELRGSVLVFDFWATWCPPCLASHESLERTAEVFKGQPVRFFAVNALESAEPGDPLAFVSSHGITTEVVLQGDALHSFFAAGNLPALAVVGAEGLSYGGTVGFHGEGSELYVQELIRGALSQEE